MAEGQRLQSQTSDDSSASSSAPTPMNRRPDAVVGQEGNAGRRGPTTPVTGQGPLSPKRTAELAGRSPGTKGKGREGSDGTPSMGSSFSDLDGMSPSFCCYFVFLRQGLMMDIDASVTQSALEEALASNMQAGGGMASRMSSISQALRSRYL